MRIDIKNKGHIIPEPVLIIATFNEDNTVNLMTAARGMMCDYNKVALIISKDHQTMDNILRNKSFSISFGEKDFVNNIDYVGIISYKDDKDKFNKSKFSYFKSKFINAPIINELSIALECEVESIDLDKEMVIANIINTSIDDKIYKDNKIDYSLFNPISYDPFNHEYLEINKVVGKAFSDGNKLK